MFTVLDYRSVDYKLLIYGQWTISNTALCWLYIVVAA